MKRKRAGRDENSVKRGKFLARIAGLTSLQSGTLAPAANCDSDNPSENADSDTIVDNIGQIASSNPIHSTPLHFDDVSPAVDFGNLSPLPDEDVSEIGHSFESTHNGAMMMKVRLILKIA